MKPGKRPPPNDRRGRLNGRRSNLALAQTVIPDTFLEDARFGEPVAEQDHSDAVKHAHAVVRWAEALP